MGLDIYARYLKDNGYLTILNGGVENKVVSRGSWYAEFHLYDDPGDKFTYTAGTISICLRRLAEQVQEYLEHKRLKEHACDDTPYAIGGVVIGDGG